MRLFKLEREVEDLDIPLPVNVQLIPILDMNSWQVESSKHSAPPLQEIKKNLERLVARNKECGAVVCTPGEVAFAKDHVDWLYIPGEFSRQADLLVAARDSGKRILLEKGAFLTPPDTLLALEKVKPANTILVDAGAQFGYSTRVLDPRSLWLLSQNGQTETAVHLSALLGFENQRSAWSPDWTQDEAFIEPLLATAFALGVRNIVFSDIGKHAQKRTHQILAALSKQGNLNA